MLPKIIDAFACIQDILGKSQPLSPRVIIVDSIQTVYLEGVAGSAGGPAQVRIFNPYTIPGKQKKILVLAQDVWPIWAG